MSNNLRPRDLRVFVLAGSARTGSLNGALAAHVSAKLRAAGMAVTAESIRDFPVPQYDGDAQERDGVPPAAHRFAGLLRDHDATVIVSPEYNYSMPGNLKNLIDWVSRIKPWPTVGVDGMLMSASPGPVGGHRGLIALRVPLEGIGMRLHPTMFTLAQAHEALGADGEFADEARSERLTGMVEGFLDVVEAGRMFRMSGAAA